MGWTHSWVRDTELDELAFKAAVHDCQIVLLECGAQLAGFDGTGIPIFEPDHIVFNGSDPASCEPFVNGGAKPWRGAGGPIP